MEIKCKLILTKIVFVPHSSSPQGIRARQQNILLTSIYNKSRHLNSQSTVGLIKIDLKKCIVWNSFYLFIFFFDIMWNISFCALFWSKFLPHVYFYYCLILTILKIILFERLIKYLVTTLRYFSFVTKRIRGQFSPKVFQFFFTCYKYFPWVQVLQEGGSRGPC